jgi:hypothetical protein
LEPTKALKRINNSQKNKQRLSKMSYSPIAETNPMRGNKTNNAPIYNLPVGLVCAVEKVGERDLSYLQIFGQGPDRLKIALQFSVILEARRRKGLRDTLDELVRGPDAIELIRRRVERGTYKTGSIPLITDKVIQTLAFSPQRPVEEALVKYFYRDEEMPKDLRKLIREYLTGYHGLNGFNSLR